MPSVALVSHSLQTARHRTEWVEAGPVDGPLMIFIHGWHFGQAARDFEADVESTLSLLYRRASKKPADEPTSSSAIRVNGGWFGESHRAPSMPRDETLLSQSDFDAFVAAFRASGFDGPSAWYLNDAANVAYAAQAPRFGRIALPALFLHAARDTVHSRLAAPMREDCARLSEVTIDSGHELMLENPDDVNKAIADWLAANTFG